MVLTKVTIKLAAANLVLLVIYSFSTSYQNHGEYWRISRRFHMLSELQRKLESTYLFKDHMLLEKNCAAWIIFELKEHTWI